MVVVASKPVPGSRVVACTASSARTSALVVSAPEAVDAPAVTVAGTLMAFMGPMGTGPGVEQVTTWPAVEQAQPVPEADPGVTPAGKVSLTLTVPASATVANDGVRV